MNLSFASSLILRHIQELALSLLAVSKSGFRLVGLLQEDETVPGTTDGIMLMGILIVLTIVIPIAGGG
jgi:hypothetical protein